jgi:hypothetical protein
MPTASDQKHHESRFRALILWLIGWRKVTR